MFTTRFLHAAACIGLAGLVFANPARADLVSSAAGLPSGFNTFAPGSAPTPGTATESPFVIGPGNGSTGNTTTTVLPSVLDNNSGLGLSNPYTIVLRANFEASLWNLVTAAYAQQAGLPMALAETSVAGIVLAADDTPSAVPLPAAGWLFITGLMGLVGSRLKPRPAAPPQVGIRLPLAAAA